MQLVFQPMHDGNLPLLRIGEMIVLILLGIIIVESNQSYKPIKLQFIEPRPLILP